MKRNFTQLLKECWQEGKFVCVGLDPDLDRIPESVKEDPAHKGKPTSIITAFNRAIIDATFDLVCAYKPQSAYFEALGEEGYEALRETVQYIKQKAPHVPIILDAKRADIGSTNLGYVQSTFTALEADAITVHPYLGKEALEPFLAQQDKGIIVLCRTSNPGAGELQDLVVASSATTGDRLRLYEYVARQVAETWNEYGNCCLVVGATYPEEAKRIRELVGDMPFLIPGVGAQGGDLAAITRAAKDSRSQGIIIAASRSVLYASAAADFPSAARQVVITMQTTINDVLGGSREN